MTTSSQLSRDLTANVAALSDKSVALMHQRKMSDDDVETFQNILQKVQQTHDPKAALRSLSADELDVVRQAHGLAEPIKISVLSDEGAANLLNAPGYTHDLNNDGLTTIGEGNMFTFPPENAPASFKAAWEEASDGLSIMDIPTHMIFAVGLANIGREPGDPNWVNPYASPDYDYGNAVSEIMDSVEYQYNHNMMSFEQYQKNMSFYNKLTTAMD
ncbi:hypothetical protein [Methylophaga sulfidovorans]|uniref:Uncharacterized protein n=1 Tax=Methylophaga sulfidovorans TaxID=45496 RepID=A0A1I3W4S5_9GAMM|nr:hypothetical protein [Methylophaga sulfidovorans]SFK02440.1 hypothetical protein SAMN04488079_10431 [Methylophaga sulfidovorans]